MGALWHGAEGLLHIILEQLYNVTNSYGTAIVLLTIIIRLLLYPLNQKQMVSMQAMQKIQPRLKMLQDKYGDDRQKLGEETMRLYKEYHVNPAAGCMPMLVQLPILILLFQVLRSEKFLHKVGDVAYLGIFRLSSSAISGLSQACGGVPTQSIGAMLKAVFTNPAGLANVQLYAGNVFLIVAIALLTMYQQKMTTADNPQMATMNTIMPIFMAFICLSMPGGVMIYWGLSTLIGVFQQYFVMKNTKLEMANKPALHKNKPVVDAEEDEEEYEDDDEYEYIDEDDEEEGK